MPRPRSATSSAARNASSAPGPATPRGSGAVADVAREPSPARNPESQLLMRPHHLLHRKSAPLPPRSGGEGSGVGGLSAHSISSEFAETPPTPDPSPPRFAW